MRRGSSLYLTLHPLAGSDLNTCIREAVQVSVKTGVGVDFDFNGVHVLTGPDTDEAALSEAGATFNNGNVLAALF